MSFGSRLTHTVTIIRPSSGAQDEYGHAVLSDSVLETVKAAIQPRTQTFQGAEVPALSQAGVALSDYVIYMFPTGITTADAILHDETQCSVPQDLPTSRFEVIGVPNAAGLGHHLEVAAKLTQTAAEAEGS